MKVELKDEQTRDAWIEAAESAEKLAEALRRVARDFAEAAKANFRFKYECVGCGFKSERRREWCPVCGEGLR